METKRQFALLAAVVLTVAGAGCATMISAASQSSLSWQSVQSFGGLALGQPQRDQRGHVILPIRCDVSGTHTITVRPTAIESALACRLPRVRVREGKIVLTIRVGFAGGRYEDARCPAADLGPVPAGQYAVEYLDPDGTRRPIGAVQVPR
jgi:hypothetical protein